MNRPVQTASLVALFLYGWNGQAQLAQSSFQVALDYGRFRGDTSLTYVELCYSFPERELTYVREGDLYRGEIRFDVTVTPEGADQPSFERSWLTRHEVEDTAALESGKSLIGVEGFGVEPGKYALNVTARDNIDTLRVDSTQFALVTALFQNPDRVMVSDIQLCTNIRQSTDKEGIFYKNTFDVVPNPLGLYGVGMPVVYYYAEVYNILEGIRSEMYTVRTTVVDSYGKTVSSRDRERPRLNESSVEIGTIKVNTFMQGAYTLVFSVIDSSSERMVSSSKRFFVYNPDLAAADSLSAEQTDVLGSEYATMDEPELDMEFSQSQYVETDAERDRYSALKGADAKRKFLFDFWRNRDPDPVSTVNEAKTEYFRRVKYASGAYKTHFQDGWRTDRGRVYILYGEPDQYERHPSQGNAKPYEIWFYNNIQGGVEFVFLDRTGFSDYRLIHSSHRNELRNDNWLNEVLTY